MKKLKELVSSDKVREFIFPKIDLSITPIIFGDTYSTPIRDRPSCGPMKEMDYNGKRIIYQEIYRAGADPALLVAGIKASELYKTEHGVDAIKVLPINKRDRKDVEGRLAGITNGPINFFDQL